MRWCFPSHRARAVAAGVVAARPAGASRTRRLTAASTPTRRHAKGKQSLSLRTDCLFESSFLLELYYVTIFLFQTSHDGGDSSSITSGVENEIIKPILSILKPKKTSLKRKPPSSFKEVDETVVEPLLSQDREKPGTSQSAKIFTKTKTDFNNDKISDKSKLLGDNNIQNPISSAIITTANITLSSNDRYVPKTTVAAPMHNHMNTNVFNSYDSNKIVVTTKSQILVEIDSSKPSGYSPSPLIFTTAKIHADGKTKHMEPVQVTPVPILSTVELNLSKNGNVTTNEKKIVTTNNGNSLVSTVYNPGISSKTTTQHSNAVTSATPNSMVTCTPVVTNQNKTTTPTTSIISSILNNQTTLSNEKIINKGENITNNQKAKDGPILTPVVSKIPSTTKQTKAITSLKSTNPVIEPIKPTLSAISGVEPNQSNQQSDKSLTDKIKSNSERTQVIDYKLKDSIQANKNNTDPTAVIKPNTSSNLAKTKSGSENKQLQRQKSIAVEDTPKSKTTSGLNSSNKVDTTKDSCAKIVSSSVKPSSTSQSKIQSNTSLSKDKTPKPSANEIKTETLKSLQTRTSNTTEKPSNINSKTTNKPSSIITSTTKNDNTISTPNTTKNVSLVKTSSNLPKSVTSAITSKSMTVPSTKSTTKVTSVTSQKPQSSAVTSVTSTKPIGSGKTKLPASSTTPSVSKTSSVSASSTPISSVPTLKPATTKSAPSNSTSETTSSVSVFPTSTTVASANGIAKSDMTNKGSKSGDLTKDEKISKA